MADPVKRLNYFEGEFLRAPDFSAEQSYHAQNQREHSRLQHTPGIAEGLGVAPVGAGSTAVTVSAGAAYDSLGRRIVVAGNEQIELAGQPAGQAVFLTLAYRETQTDPTSETGISGNTRWTEAGLIEISATAPADPTAKLVLARVVRTGTAVASVDLSARLFAGVKGGDLDVRSLRLTSETIAPAGWVKAQLGVSGRADLGGSLRVSGDLIVTGTIQGDIAVGTVQAGDLVDNAVVSAAIAEADGSSAQNTNAGAGVKTGHIQDSAITTAKLANDSVTAAKIVDGSVGTVELANAAVTNAKLADNAVDAAKILDGSVGTAELANLAVSNAKLADAAVSNAKLANDSVTASKIADGNVGNSELGNGAITFNKLSLTTVVNGTFTLQPNGQDFLIGTNTQVNEFFFIDAYPLTPGLIIKWDFRMHTPDGAGVGRFITMQNLAGFTGTYVFKVFRWVMS